MEYSFINGVLFCPFCGAVGGERTADGFINSLGVMLEKTIHKDSFAVFIDGTAPVSFRVCCKGCGTRGPGAANADYAVKLWNHRKGSQ